MSEWQFAVAIIVPAIGALAWCAKLGIEKFVSATTAYIADLQHQRNLAREQHEAAMGAIRGMSDRITTSERTNAMVLEELKGLNRMVASIEQSRSEEVIARREDSALTRELVKEVKKLGEGVTRISLNREKKNDLDKS